MYNVDEIIRLSNEEGLNDREIAVRLNCNRSSVTRIRNRNKIPKCNKDNRKDKSYKCINCGNIVYIKRVDTLKAFCDTCIINIT